MGSFFGEGERETAINTKYESIQTKLKIFRHLWKTVCNSLDTVLGWRSCTQRIFVYLEFRAHDVISRLNLVAKCTFLRPRLDRTEVWPEKGLLERYCQLKSTGRGRAMGKFGGTFHTSSENLVHTVCRGGRLIVTICRWAVVYTAWSGPNFWKKVQILKLFEAFFRLTNRGIRSDCGHGCNWSWGLWAWF